MFADMEEVENTLCEKKGTYKKQRRDSYANLMQKFTHEDMHTSIWKATGLSAVTLKVAVAFSIAANSANVGLDFFCIYFSYLNIL